MILLLPVKGHGMWKYKYLVSEELGGLLALCEEWGHPDRGCFEIVQIMTVGAEEGARLDGDGLVDDDDLLIDDDGPIMIVDDDDLIVSPWSTRSTRHAPRGLADRPSVYYVAVLKAHVGNIE